jgi:hypothetical protein
MAKNTLTALIFTVGTRDVQPIKDGKLDYDVIFRNEGLPARDRIYTENKAFRARVGGEYILRRWEHYKQEIITPIFSSTASYLKNNNITELNRIIFVATDQNQDMGERFYQADSLYFAQILKKLLEEKIFPITAEKIDIELVGENIIYLDKMYPFWLKRFENKQSPLYALQKKNYQVYLCTQGGVDAINTSLLLNCLNKIGKRLVNLTVNESTKICSEQTFNRQYLEDREKIRLAELLKVYDYAAIKNLEIPSSLKHIAGYAGHRFNFDFEGAKAELAKLNDEAMRTWRDNQIVELNNIEKSKEAKVKELVFNAEILYKQERYVDCVLRLIRVAEEIAEKELARIFGEDILISRNYKPTLERRFQQEPGLERFLDEYKVETFQGPQLLNYEKPTKIVYKALLEYYAAKDPAAEKCSNTYNLLMRLNNLRNNSIGAHSFDPVSLNLIYENLAQGQEKLLKAPTTRAKEQKQKKELVKEIIFKPLKEYFNLAENPYDGLNELIR